jgi:hypothetical protein
MSNVARAAGILLGMQGVSNMAELQARWNEGVPERYWLEVEETKKMHREAMSDESNLREIAVMRLRQGHHYIEVR